MISIYVYVPVYVYVYLYTNTHTSTCRRNKAFQMLPSYGMQPLVWQLRFLATNTPRSLTALCNHRAIGNVNCKRLIKLFENSIYADTSIINQQILTNFSNYTFYIYYVTLHI